LTARLLEDQKAKATRAASFRPGERRMRLTAPLLAAPLLAALSAGCVQVRAPDKPIEINLNVNIKQEVVVKLERDAQDLVKNNPGIF
jgi:hypothetical protein